MLSSLSESSQHALGARSVFTILYMAHLIGFSVAVHIHGISMASGAILISAIFGSLWSVIRLIKIVIDDPGDKECVSFSPDLAMVIFIVLAMVINLLLCYSAVNHDWQCNYFNYGIIAAYLTMLALFIIMVLLTCCILYRAAKFIPDTKESLNMMNKRIERYSATSNIV